MRLLILTSDTPHHNYFIRQVIDFCDQLFVVYETKAVLPIYPTDHQFEGARTSFEEGLWGADSATFGSGEVERLIHLPNINDIASLNDPIPKTDVCIVFGTRKIEAKTIEMLPTVTVNLHGGDPQLYRGLDSHLWALWHRDKNGLKTCLHYLSAELDTGDIISMKNLDISQIDYLYELRALNTNACIELCRNFLIRFSRGEPIKALSQKHFGRYYSFMPSDLKDVVVRNFKSSVRNSKSEI